MSEFRLEEWERPPGSDVPFVAEADAVAQVLYEEEQHEALLRYLPYNEPPNSTIWRVFAFFPHLDGRGNRILLRGSAHTLSLLPYYSPHPYGLERLPEELNERLVKGELVWGHYSHWGEERQLVMDSQSQAWLAPHWGYCHWFECSALRDLNRRLDAREIRNVIQAEWENPASDVRFASDWCQLDDLERGELLLGEPHFIQPIKEAMQLVLQLEVGSISRWNISLTGEPEGKIYHEAQLNQEKISALGKWQELLQSKVVSQFQTQLLKHKCVQQYLERMFAIPLAGLDHVSSYHERLEARFRLHEWLEQNAPDRMDLLKQ